MWPGWVVFNTSVPVPNGEWFLVETYWKHSAGPDGRVWVAINGQTICDHSGRNRINDPLSLVFPMKLYVDHESIDIAPYYSWTDELSIYDSIPGQATQTENDERTPPRIRFPHLLQTYPNPFNPSTTIMFELARDAYVTLDVYDVMGREVLRLVDGRRGAGRHYVRWNAAAVPSGVYVYRLKAGRLSRTKRMILLR